MRKLLPLVIIGILLLSGVQAIEVTESKNNIELNESFSFSTPIIKEYGQYAAIQLEETELSLSISGKPEMPMISYTLDLPFGAKNIQISYRPYKEFELDIPKKIQPTPESVTYESVNLLSPEFIEDVDIYSSEERYPATWYDTKITSGLKSKKERSTHISFYLYPVQYSPALNKIYYIKEAELMITYDLPTQTMTYDEEFDLVIIAPQKFSSSLQSLVTHKNDNNVKTYLKTTEDIFEEYSGFDKPEKIKYFIKDAIETNDVLYVLLVGGLKSRIYAKDRDDSSQGSKNWHVPVRYTNIRKGGLEDPGTLSDLYYADIYDGEGNFSSWDSNGDGVYAHWTTSPQKKDILDLNPDVYVTRLPCRNINQVKTVVKKIIQYETITPNTEPWYKRMVGISGVSHAMYNGQPDGEYLTDLSFGYMEDYIDEEVRVYASNNGTGNPIPVPKDIVKAFTNGAHFVHFSGHGHPLRWDTHPVDDLDRWMGGIHARNMWQFFNNKKLPIVVVGGCHNAQFNITIMTTLRSSKLGEDKWYWTHGDFGPACFCWKMLLIPWGGAIASVGGTGLTTSKGGEPDSGNGRLGTGFYYQVGQNGATSFGEAHYGSIQKYIDENYITRWDAHVVAIWNALGDPSLKLL